MVTSVGAMGGNSPLDQLRSRGVAAKAAPLPTQTDETDNAPVSAAKEMASAGAPVDLDKVARIKAGIADGSYKADPKAIADKMIALDIPTKG